MNIRRSVAKWMAGGILLLSSAVPASAYADSPVNILFDGRQLPSDVPPVIDQGVTMAPIRALLTPLGAEIGWDPVTETVSASLDSIEIQVSVGQSVAQINGEAIPLPVPVENRNGSTLVPLRVLAEALGLTVDWEEESQTALIFSGRGDRTPVVSRGESRRMGQLVAARAAESIGAAYAWGGTSPEMGFDCSGFVYYQGLLAGVELPRTSYEQYLEGIDVQTADLAAGDLVFFSTYDSGASHVGIYDGNGGFIHAQSPEVGVARTSLSNPWWAARYLGARRIFR